MSLSRDISIIRKTKTPFVPTQQQSREFPFPHLSKPTQKFSNPQTPRQKHKNPENLLNGFSNRNLDNFITFPTRRFQSLNPLRRLLLHPLTILTHKRIRI